jgi:transcriptional regulator with XRE-family HTH domain
MSTLSHKFLDIKDNLFERLRQARLKLGIKQSELAEIGGVSRATQVSYETNGTAPNTDYLRLVQSSGLDIPFVLFGNDASQVGVGASQIDWDLIQESVEAVAFFCIKAAPNCPDSYKWQLIKKVYASLSESRQNASEVQANSNLEVVRHVWEKV